MKKNSDPERSADGNSDGLLQGAKPESFDAAPLMMTADELAETLCISKRQVWRLKAKGDIPKPVKIGSSVRWRRGDILEWIEAGCPSVSTLLNTLVYHLVWRPAFAIISLFVRS